MIGWLVTL